MSERKSYSFVTIVRRLMPIYFRSAPWPISVNILTGIIAGLMLTGVVIVTQRLFEAVSLAADGQIGVAQLIIPLLMLAAITVGQQVIDFFNVFMFWGITHLLSAGELRMVKHSRLQRIDPVLFENPEFLDDINKAKEGVDTIPHMCNNLLDMLSRSFMYIVSVGVYLFSLQPLLLVILVISFIPALISLTVRTRVFSKLEEESAPLRREYEYYQKTLTDREFFKETRILGAFRFFHRLFVETMALFTRKQWQTERKMALLELGLNISTFLGLAGAAWLLFTATMSGEISVGAFAAVLAAILNMFYMMQGLIVWQMGRINQSIGKAANFVRMMDLPDMDGDIAETDFSYGVKAENVSFAYPGKAEPAVRNVSLTIKPGETVAIVGDNGAGKSTLVRLLTGIYRPGEGHVLVGKLDTATTAPGSIYRGISGVFQRYQRYKMTLAENISISDTSRIPDKAGMETALVESGFEGYTDGAVALDDMLAPEFDGIDLSGGQWQRVAIARGLYRANGFIVLDEPTSAIDPIEETRIYTQFQRLAEHKCALVVTHRLGSAKLAHRIIVMEGGEIVDVGTHDDLLLRPGKYADMWAAQAKWYERQDV